MSRDNPEKPEFGNLEINSEHILHTGMEPSWALRKWKGHKRKLRAQAPLLKREGLPWKEMCLEGLFGSTESI